MNILWLTLDRSKQTIKHFDNFREAVEKIANVTVIKKSQQGLTGRAFAEGIYSGKIKDQEIVPSGTFNKNQFDVIVTDALFAMPNENWGKFRNIPKAYIAEDLHGDLPKKQKELGIKYKFDFLFTRYFSPTKLHPECFNHHKVFWLPHCVPESYFIEDSTKVVGVLLSGSCNSYYPFRQAVEKVFKNDPRFWRIERYRGPNETDRNESGVDYIKNLLSKAKIHPVCGGKAELGGYVVCKYAEIPAAGTLAISPEFEDLKAYGFKDRENIVFCKKHEDILKTFNYYLENNEERIRIVNNGRQLIKNRHTCDKRAAEFIETLVTSR